MPCLPPPQDTEADDFANVADVAEFQKELEQTETGSALPRNLTGDTALDRFENAWRTGYTSLEAAMIVNGLYRDDMPAIPQESGSGEQVVYSLSEQRVWLVAEDDFLIDTYLVSGRDWMPNVGTFHVWGKSPRTTGYNPSYTMNFMVRFAVGSHGGNIGFHDLPLYKGRPVPTTAELGQPLSGGCVRQDGYHARMMYAWTEIGTTVEVVPRTAQDASTGSCRASSATRSSDLGVAPITIGLCRCESLG